MARLLDGKYFAPLIIAMVVLAPLVSPGTFGSYDWESHTWLAGYFGEYLHRHLEFPMVINTQAVIGIPEPMFYGFLFYPIVGAVSVLTGGEVSIRIAAFIVTAYQLINVWKLVDGLTKDRLLKLGITLIIATNIYQLTNLFNRGAVAEYVAVSLTISAVICWLRAEIMGQARRKLSDYLQGGCCMAFAAATHPITALLGTISFAVVVLVGAYVWGRLRLRELSLLAIAPAFAIVMFPWLRALSAPYGKFVNSPHSSGLMMFSDSIGTFGTRLNLLPYDPRLSHAATNVSTPYLDTQINLPLAFLILALIVRIVVGKCRRLTRAEIAGFASLGIAAFFIWASVDGRVWSQLPPLFGAIQFAYRLVGYVDLFLVVALVFFIVGGVLGQKQVGNYLRLVVVICAVLGVQNLLIKQSHARSNVRPGVLAGAGFSGERSSLGIAALGVPALYESTTGLHAATVSERFEQISLPVDLGEHFGDVGTSRTVAGSRSLATNVMTSGVNGLSVNGAVVSESELSFGPRDGTAGNFLVVERTRPINAVGYVLHVDKLWVRLREISLLVIILWVLSIGVIPRIACRLLFGQYTSNAA